MNWWLKDRFIESRIPRSRFQDDWDKIWMEQAVLVGKRSKCASRHIGAVVVKDNILISDGYNGAPRGVALCQGSSECPRRGLGFQSGQGLEVCPAVHGEVNAVIRAGERAKGATLYCDCPLPCKSCAGIIINAGIREVVCREGADYDDLAIELFKQANVRVRRL